MSPSVKYLLRLALCLAVILTSACSSLFGRGGYFRDRGDDYLYASEIPPMKVPKEMDSSAISELFVIPPVNNEFIDLEREFEVPRSAFDEEREKAQVKIQTLDSRRWILVNSGPEIVWPRIKRFLDANKLPLASEDPLTGKMETSWLALKDEVATKDRYRFHVEQGLHASTTEIHVLQITASATTPGTGNVNWPALSVNPEREKWMIDALASHLAQDDEAPVSLLAQSIGRTQKVSFVQPYQGEAFILMTLDRERVIASVSGALNRAPFAVEDIHRGQGFVYASYDPEFVEKTEEQLAEKAGFFARLLGSEKRAEEKKQQRLLHYRIQIEAIAKDEMRVLVRDREGKPLPAQERDRLLQKIRQALL